MRGDNHGELQAVRAAAISTLSQDLITAEVLAALEDAEIVTLLLKGPAIAAWLYQDGDLRPYGDTDLLVAPDQWEAATQVLASLGFSLVSEPDPPGRSPHALVFSRVRDRANVDLHRALYGLAASPSDQWRALSQDTSTIAIAGRQATVLGTPARALHVVLHAAHHGPTMRHPLEDLERALATVEIGDWNAARELAERLDGLAAFAGGLRLHEQGRALMAQLDIPDPSSTEVLLRTAARTPGALHLEWLAQSPGIRTKLRVLARGLLPPAEGMRVRWKIARRGRIGLAASYGLRLAYLPVQGPRALAIWLRARRRASRPQPPGRAQTARRSRRH